MSEPSDDAHHVVLALGANLGDPVAAVRDGFLVIAADERCEVIACSSLYATAPIAGPEQPDYINAVLVMRTSRLPQEVLALAHAVEVAHDRAREVRWGPRTLDIDVVAYDDLVLEDADLTLPHPRAHERAFVLVPWCEVEPDAVLPGRGPIVELLPGVADQQIRAIPVDA